MYVCVSLLGFYAPLTMGRPPAVPHVLITPGAWRRQCLTVYVTGILPGTCDSAAEAGVYPCVFMFRLCYGLVTACEWDAPQKKAVHCEGHRSSHNWQRGRLEKRMTLLQLSPLPSSGTPDRQYQRSWGPGQRSRH